MSELKRSQKKELYQVKVLEIARFLLDKLQTEYKRLRTLECCKDNTDSEICDYAVKYTNGLINTLVKAHPQEKKLYKDGAKKLVETLEKM